MTLQEDELSLLKSEHMEIKGSLNEISMRMASNEQLTLQIAADQKILSEALKSHFEEEKEMKDAQKQSNADIHKMRDLLQDIKMQLANNNLETHKLVEAKLNEVYSRIRDNENKFSDFRAQAEKEHNELVRSAEKNTMDRVFKHVSSLWAVGCVCGALVVYIFNSHVDDFKNHTNQCEARFQEITKDHKNMIREHSK